MRRKCISMILIISMIGLCACGNAETTESTIESSVAQEVQSEDLTIQNNAEINEETKSDKSVEAEDNTTDLEESKPEEKEEVTEESKSEEKVEAKEESKTEVQIEAKEESKSEAQIEEKTEVKEEPKPEAKPAVSEELVSLNFPKTYIGNKTQAELDAYAMKFGFESMIKNPDNSATVLMTKEKYNSELSETKKGLDELDKFLTESPFVEAKRNDAYTEYIVKTTSTEYGGSEMSAEMYALAYAPYYNILLGNPIADVSITFINNETGLEIE